MTTLAERLLSDALWHRLLPLLPAPPSHARGGALHRARPRLHGRDHLHGPHLHRMGVAAGGRVRLQRGRRLRIRYDRDFERFSAFVLLAGDRLCYNRLPCAANARSP
jgi:hypothetical protein